jgi:protein SCO1
MNLNLTKLTLTKSALTKTTGTQPLSNSFWKVILGALFSLQVVALSSLAIAQETVDPTSFYSNFNEVSLTDQDSHTFQVKSFTGKVTLYNFIFTHCSNVCPVQTKQISEVQKLLSAETRKHVQFISVSLDPLNDTPSALKSFAKQHGADLSNWSFVTGTPQGIQTLSDRLSLYGNKPDPAKKNIVRPNGHETMLWLVDSNGRLMQRYSGDIVDTKRLAIEIGTLVEMSLTNTHK